MKATTLATTSGVHMSGDALATLDPKTGYLGPSVLTPPFAFDEPAARPSLSASRR